MMFVVLMLTFPVVKRDFVCMLVCMFVLSMCCNILCRTVSVISLTLSRLRETCAAKGLKWISFGKVPLPCT
ncbi:hypothetical protein BC628DRAFT_1352692 [Trametes gibbosa]|nr:hypothetical protein BC628DRAFT_1352692 [Trametes gibbosa]